EADHEQDWRPRIEERGPWTRCFGLGRDLNVVVVQPVGEPFELRRCVSAKLRAITGCRDYPSNLVARDGDALDLAFVDGLEERRECHRRFRALECRGEIPDQDPHYDEYHPEQQALERRVQPGPPKCLTFKSITPCEGS